MNHQFYNYSDERFTFTSEGCWVKPIQTDSTLNNNLLV